jgi:hypothetical protein
MGSREGTSAASVDRGAPPRPGDRRDFDGVDAGSVADSAPSVEADKSDESAGEAQAVPAPPMTIPTPKVTAKQPTRPTNAEAPIAPNPLICRRSQRQQTAVSQTGSSGRNLCILANTLAYNGICVRKQSASSGEPECFGNCSEYLFRRFPATRTSSPDPGSAAPAWAPPASSASLSFFQRQGACYVRPPVKESGRNVGHRRTSEGRAESPALVAPRSGDRRVRPGVGCTAPCSARPAVQHTDQSC